MTHLLNAMRSVTFAPLVYDQNNHTILNVKDAVETCNANGWAYRSPEGRQNYNDMILKRYEKRYLIGKYLEDRSVFLQETPTSKEGRHIHMGIDLFCKDLEDVHSPYPGKVIYKGEERAPFGFGHYMVVEHELAGIPWWSLFAHLHESVRLGHTLERGEILGTLGDHKENGGWSIHLHYQLFTQKPDDIFGYVVPDYVSEAKKLCPDPNYVLKLMGLWTNHDDE
jgi:murein DD-endopeptidase MepM/ murein hydrolase activator NlpD